MSATWREVAEALDIESWFEREGLPFKKGRGVSGVQINAKECPACGDRKWKVYLNADTGAGNCFKCEEKFSKSRFIERTTGLSGRDLFTYLKEASTESGWKPRRASIVAVENGSVVMPISFALPTAAGQNLVYLEKRGITADQARYFHLRYCEIGWWNYFDQEGIRKGQRFDSRVIIPVYDLDGSLVTFQGRDVTGTHERKYLFPITLPGSGHFLYNGLNAIGAKRVIVGEGVFDVMAQKRAIDQEIPLRDVVPIGTFGKHLSYGALDGNDQLGRFLQLKQRGLLEVTIMWDGEHKALKAALAAARLLRGIGLAVKIAVLPRDKDPNEVLPEVVIEAFYKAEPYTPQLEIRWLLRDPIAT